MQNEIFNANEFFLNRSGTARPQFRRNETYLGLGGPIRKNKTFFYAAVQRTDFLSGYANRAIVTTASPAGLGDVRTPQTIAQVANQWLQSGAQDNPQFAANFLAALRRFPADQIPGLENQFFASTTNAAQPLFRQLTAADIHPVAINILNVKRNGKFLLPSVTSANRLLPGNATFGREQEQVNAFPTFFNSWSGSLSLEHNFSFQRPPAPELHQVAAVCGRGISLGEFVSFAHARPDSGLCDFAVAHTHLRAALDQ